MMNWVTNKINAPKHVIQAILNKDGQVDFSTVLHFTGPHKLNKISYAAEEAAEIICGLPLSTNPILAYFEASNRERFDIKKLSDGCFTQFIGMVENYRACGYIHAMDFASKVWDPKCNSCETNAITEEEVSFDTNWSCPKGVFVELSKIFPDDMIKVVFADEDIGCNCGYFSLKGGVMVDHNIAPEWIKMTDAEKAKWQSFACKVKGFYTETSEHKR